MLNSTCTTYAGSDGKLNAELFASSGDCIKIIDLDGRLSQLNPGGIVALELAGAEQVLGATWWELWPSDSRALVSDAFKAARQGRVTSFHAFCPTAQGSDRWWDVVASPILDATGAVREIMVVSRDVSALFLARQALHEADRRKDEFLETVAHELRNPISAAVTATELLKLKSWDLDRTIEVASLIQRQLKHMSRIAEDLLDASRIRRGEMVLSQQELNLKSVIAEAFEQLESAFTAKNQQVAMHLCEEACTVKGDHTRLVQLIGNLLGNAVRYTPERGAIDLILQRKNDLIEFSVVDTGIGMLPEQLLTIFDLYSQGRKSSARKSGGLGLGLSLVRALAEAHGGQVSAESGGRNLGSRFTITLPAIVPR